MKDISCCKAYDAPDVDLIRTGHYLKEQRLKNRLKVSDLQEYFGFDYPNAIYDWEKGLKLPNISNLIALAELYEITLDEILRETSQDFSFYDIM